MNMNVLSGSVVNRKNILNNQFAVSEIYKKSGIRGFRYQNQVYLTTQQVADYFEVDTRTIRRYLNKYDKELVSNGYKILAGEELQILKTQINPDDLGPAFILSPQVGIFSIKSFLNLAMLLSDSLKAQELRKIMLETVVSVINQRAGGTTKYINQRDDTYLIASYYNEGYHKRFIDALSKYVIDDPAKYPNYTDRIYREIFHENTREYKRILDLAKKRRLEKRCILRSFLQYLVLSLAWRYI